MRRRGDHSCAGMFNHSPNGHCNGRIYAGPSGCRKAGTLETELWGTRYACRRRIHHGCGALAIAELKAFIKGLEGKRKAWDEARASYLYPLLSAVKELIGYLKTYVHKLENSESRSQLGGWYERIKDVVDKGCDSRSLFWQCNEELYFSVATMYATAKVVALATRVRSRLPSPEFRSPRIGAPTDEKLRSDMIGVRNSFSGDQDGFWDILQDSIGNFVTHRDGTLFCYREFCEALNDRSNSVWLLRLVIFYLHVECRSAKIVQVIESLSKLEQTLTEITK
jgi:hypothetical protein